MTSRMLLLLTVALASMPLLAGGPTSKTWDGLQSLTPSDRIRVRDADDRLHDGMFVQWTPEGLTIQKKKGEVVQLGRSQVVRVAAVRKGSRGKGALIAGAVGFGGGFALGAALTGQITDMNNPPVKDRLQGGCIFGAFFGGIGAAIGALTSGHSEVTLYTKPKRE